MELLIVFDPVASFNMPEFGDQFYFLLKKDRPLNPLMRLLDNWSVLCYGGPNIVEVTSYRIREYDNDPVVICWPGIPATGYEGLFTLSRPVSRRNDYMLKAINDEECEVVLLFDGGPNIFMPPAHLHRLYDDRVIIDYEKIRSQHHYHLDH